MDLHGSTAFVTGANRGLGLSLTRAVLARGARKVYAGTRTLGMKDIPGVVPIQLDVTDPRSIAAAASECADVTLLINNAGIARLMDSTLDPGWIGLAREIFETNFYGLVMASQAFAPVIATNGGGAIVNVLSDTSWFSRPMLSAYSATKSAAWSYTNALRIELREKGIQVLGLHVGYMDTDMTRGFDLKKSNPDHVAADALAALESGEEEVMIDENTRLIKQSLSGKRAYYLIASAPG
ncbi:MAG: SDR family oxidoreductase [Proteobacteria bacterium]|nr:SDR family oxidoreductase [Burkholderiales bacterium]